MIPLLEEVRCGLASAIEAIAEAPFCEIKSVTALKHDKLMCDVEVGYWENRERGEGEPCRTLRGDFVLISDSKPCDMQYAGCTCNFASVEKNHESESGDSCTSSSIQLKTAHSLEIEDKKSKSSYMVYLMNMTAQKRIWRAMRMRKNLKIIEKVLTRNVLGEEDCEICPLKSHIEVEENLGLTLLSKLNSSVGNIECNHRLSVQLIWGPPGTGKTTASAILLHILLSMNVRMVVCAPTNTAIEGLATRVIEVRNSIISEAEKSFLSCPEMLIIGDNGNLKFCSDGCISHTSSREFCLQKASLIFCTTNSSYKLHSILSHFFFWYFDDDAQQKEAETTIALQIPDIRHAILVGDEMQSSSTVNSKLLEKAGLLRGFFERLSSIGHPKHMLNVQYRMHRSLSRFQIQNSISIRYWMHQMYRVKAMMGTVRRRNLVELVGKLFQDDFLNQCKEKLFEGNLEVPREESKVSALCNNSITTASNHPEDCTSIVEESKENMLVPLGSPKNLIQDSPSESACSIFPAMILSSMSTPECLVFFPSLERTYSFTFETNLPDFDIIGQSLPTGGSWLILHRFFSREICLFNGRRRVDIPDLPSEPQTLFVRASFTGNPDVGCYIIWLEFYDNYFLTRVYNPTLGAWEQGHFWNRQVGPMGMIATHDGYNFVDRLSGDLWSFKNYWEVLDVIRLESLLAIEEEEVTSICSLLDEEDNLARFVL